MKSLRKYTKIVSLFSFLVVLTFVTFGCGVPSTSLEDSAADWEKNGAELSFGDFSANIPSGALESTLGSDALVTVEAKEINIKDEMKKSGLTLDMGEGKVLQSASISFNTDEETTEDVFTLSEDIELALPSAALPSDALPAAASLGAIPSAYLKEQLDVQWYFGVYAFMIHPTTRAFTFLTSTWFDDTTNNQLIRVYTGSGLSFPPGTIISCAIFIYVQWRLTDTTGATLLDISENEDVTGLTGAGGRTE